MKGLRYAWLSPNINKSAIVKEFCIAITTNWHYNYSVKHEGRVKLLVFYCLEAWGQGINKDPMKDEAWRS